MLGASGCSCVCSLVKNICPQREREIMEIFQMRIFAVPTTFKILAHKEKPVCVCVCVSKPGLLCLQQSLRSAVQRGHRLFSFFSPRHTESSCCFLLFMALQLFFNSALCLFLHTSLCQCFPSPRLRNLPHLLLAHFATVENLFTVSAAHFLSGPWNSVSLCFLVLWKSIHTTR